MKQDLLQKTLAVLDFQRVREELCSCCRLEGAREVLARLEPSFDYEEVALLCARTNAARELADSKGAPSFQAAPGIPDSIARAEKGAVLTPGELLQIAALLACAQGIHAYGAALTPQNPLFDYFTLTNGDRELEDRIRTSVLNEEQLADRASSVLFDLRRKLTRASAKVRETLQQFLTGSRASYLQDPIVTMRSGRFVIPVKTEYRAQVPGLVHDTSSSGATIFVEPMPVVEQNNEIKILENEEQKEIERILSELSALCAEKAHLIQTDFSCLTQLAVQFAKAEYAYRLEAHPLLFHRGEKTVLHGARHPLLDRKTAVPIDLSIGADYDTLVITGPNTGGKTVTLKTMGLFAVMHQCGLQLPAKEGSEIGFFPAVLADIGDEQSIEQSLSTFSAHMVNIVSMLREVTQGALVLFDELGAGTDPLEGAALAVSILEKARSLGAFSLATTHYAELKTYALETEGVENASCEFDLRSLRPTYRLLTGIPGRSNAFQIALRLGLPEEIIQKAQGLMSGDSLRFEKVVSKLEAERIILEEKLNEAVQSSERAKSADRQAQLRAREVLDCAQKEAERITAQSKRLLETARRASENAYDEVERLQKAAKEKRDELLLQEARNRLKTVFEEADDVSEKIFTEEEVPAPPRPFAPGDTVRIAGTNKTGVIEKLQKDDLVIRADNSRIKLAKTKVILVEEKRAKAKRTPERNAISSTRATIKNEVDLRGMIGEDAWFVTDKYLDDARLAGLDTARLIHGKGTGALRQYLWRMLKGDPRITEYRLGVYGEGDSGVTVVTLK